MEQPLGVDSHALVLAGDQSVPCPECDEVLPSARALYEHKEDMMKTKRSHMDCTKCRLKFHSVQAYRLHYRQFHIAEQKLECPACKATFNRGSALFSHLEAGGCEKLGDAVKAYTNVKREQTLSFIRALRAKDIAADAGYQIGPGKSDHDYGAYIGKQNPDYQLTEDEIVRLSLLRLEEEHNLDKDASSSREVNLPVRSSSEAYHHGDSKQPDLLKDEAPAGSSLVDNKNAWATGSKQLTSNAPRPAALKPQELLKILEEVDRQMPRDEHDPDAPGFSVARYWAEVLGKFKCPHSRCTKSFKQAAGLVTHLRSDTHGREFFICPQCQSKFGTITALAQHAESKGIKCTIQKSDAYRMFIAQLTGGILDIQGSMEDRSPQYAVTDRAKEDLGDGVEGVLRVLTAHKMSSELQKQSALPENLVASGLKLLTAREHHANFCEDFKREMLRKHGAHKAEAVMDMW